MPFETETDVENSTRSSDTDAEYETTTTTTSSTSRSNESGGEVWIGLTGAEGATKEKSTEQKSYILQQSPATDKTISYGQCVLQDKDYSLKVDKMNELKSEHSQIPSLAFSPPSAKYRIYEDDQCKNIKNSFRANENGRQKILKNRHQSAYVQQNPPMFPHQQQFTPMCWCPIFPFSPMLHQQPPPPMLYYPMMPSATYGGYPVQFPFNHSFTYGPPAQIPSQQS